MIGKIRFAMFLVVALGFLALLPTTGECGIFGRIAHRVTHPFAAIGSGGNSACANGAASGPRYGRFRSSGGGCASGACNAP